MVSINKRIKKTINKNKEIDLYLFSKIYKFLFNNRYKVYAILFLVVFNNVASKIPYFNLFFSDFFKSIGFLIIYMLVVFIIGFEPRRLYLATLLGLSASCILVLLNSSHAEEIANTTFLLLITAIIIDIIKNKNVLQKPEKKN